MTARESALLILRRILFDGAYANVALRTQLQREPLSVRERGLCTELVYGVLRYLNRLENILQQLANRSVATMDSEVVIAIYIALYQIIYLDKIPTSAAVNESVNLVKKHTHVGSAKFTNAILRNYLRRESQFSIPSLEDHPQEHIALTYGIPLWLVEQLTAQRGHEKTLQTVQAWASPSPGYVRINTLRKEPEAILSEWEMQGIKVRPTIVPEGREIIDGDVTSLRPWLERGEIYWQDASSMLVAYAVNPQQGEVILDMCAAPGGKSTHMAALSQNQAQIVAADIHAHKVELIEENAARLGADAVRGIVQDATVYVPEAVEKYHRVLVDAPCSGWGVIGHRPDVKWRRTRESVNAFPALQTSILACAATYVRPGGRLVYSTCTLNQNENEDVIRTFLRGNPRYRLVSFSLPTIGAIAVGYTTIWPTDYRSDGFFIAVLEKEGQP